jgi:hypothetical protein
MLTFGTTLVRRSLGMIAVTSALATALVAASPANAVTSVHSPSGVVYNYHGQIRYGADLPTVTGWAFDPDKLTTPISVRIDVSWTNQACSRLLGCVTYVVSRASFTATAGLTDNSLVGSVEGPNHGFSVTLPLDSIPIGSWNGGQVCVTALNAAGTSGTDTSLGCYQLVDIELTR